VSLGTIEEGGRKMRKPTPLDVKKVWIKIFVPCFGDWDCLVTPEFCSPPLLKNTLWDNCLYHTECEAEFKRRMEEGWKSD